MSKAYDREYAKGMGFNMGMVYTIETYLSIHQCKFYVCIVHLNAKASEEEVQKSSLIDRGL